MDLIPILTRAESLFHRFERSVQAIDKKDNFPAAPSSHQRRPASSTSESAAAAGKGKSPQRAAMASSSGAQPPSALHAAIEKDKPKVISPELRELLRKDIPWRRQETS